jgi:hypothetical protein
MRVTPASHKACASGGTESPGRAGGDRPQRHSNLSSYQTAQAEYRWVDLFG